jgi:hypothetical protein
VLGTKEKKKTVRKLFLAKTMQFGDFGERIQLGGYQGNCIS